MEKESESEEEKLRRKVRQEEGSAVGALQEKESGSEEEKLRRKVREEERSAVGALQVPELFTASETSPLIRSARSDADKI